MENLNYYDGIPDMDAVPNKRKSGFDIDDFASMSNAAVYVIDFREHRFSYVSEHDLFLCGHSRDEVLNLGYDFYTKIVHPKDLPLWEKMHNAILKYLLDPEEQLENINYFSFTFRIKNLLQIAERQKYLMVHHKLKPVFRKGQIWLGICMLEISAISTSGNLEIFYKNGMNLNKYSFGNQKWELHDIEPLTDCEIDILKLSITGLNEAEIANDKLYLSIGTIRNKCSALYQKLNVNSMMQAINVAHDLINKNTKYTKILKKKKK
jgi:DNA-binding CsgD family transcriptional regulator